MTDQHPASVAQRAWSSQADDGRGVDLARARTALAAKDAAIRRRDRIAYLSALVIAPSWAAVMWFLPDLRVLAAMGFALAVWVPVQVYRRSGARVAPPADGACAVFQEALLQRELTFCLRMPRWYLLPVALSQGAILFALFTSPRFPQTAMLFWGAAGMVGTAGSVLVLARRRVLRQARELRRELALLRAATRSDILTASKG